jgi:tRNA(fMet)-specific endonuclease VapC
MTARYMMDTDTCIYLKNRRPPEIAERFRTLQRGDVVISIITFGELYNGALKSRETDAALNNITRLRERLPIQPLPIEAANAYATIRSALEKQGNIIGGNDLWIAAHALTLNLIVITNNTKEFNRVENLNVENWVI